MAEFVASTRGTVKISIYYRPFGPTGQQESWMLVAEVADGRAVNDIRNRLRINKAALGVSGVIDPHKLVFCGREGERLAVLEASFSTNEVAFGGNHACMERGFFDYLGGYLMALGQVP